MYVNAYIFFESGYGNVPPLLFWEEDTSLAEQLTNG